MARPLRLLLLEDRPDDARLILHELARPDSNPIGERVDDESGFAAALKPIST